MKVIHKRTAASVALALLAAGCTSSEAAQPIAREEVKRIVEQCGNVVGGLDTRLGQANGAAAYQAAGLVESACREASLQLMRPGGPEACQVFAQAAGMVGTVAKDSLDQPGPANASRLEQIRGSYEVEKGKCQAQIG